MYIKYTYKYIVGNMQNKEIRKSCCNKFDYFYQFSLSSSGIFNINVHIHNINNTL